MLSNTVEKIGNWRGFHNASLRLLTVVFWPLTMYNKRIETAKHCLPCISMEEPGKEEA